MVGEREVLVPEVARLAGHRRDRVAAVGPVGVRVQIALELRAQRLARVGAGLGHVAQQLLEVLRRLAAQRFGDHRRGLLADAGNVGEPAGVGEALQLVVGDERDLARGAPERLHAIRRLAPAHQQLGDALERLDRRHAREGTLPRGRVEAGD